MEYYDQHPYDSRRACPPPHGDCPARCCCCPWPVRVSFTLLKLDSASGAPVRGAGFTLYQCGRPAACAVSDAYGLLHFNGLTPGEYTLAETSAPDGYLPDDTSRIVVVDACGRVTVDGSPVANTVIYNTPSRATGFSFFKVDAETRQPVPGAVFTLSNGSTATSDRNGLVDFGTLAAGTYTLIETGTPDGYLPETTSYTVAVSEDGSITVDGLPADRFTAQNIPNRSEMPFILAVSEGNTIVAGLGIPGAAIQVILPNGTRLYTTVNVEGNWAVSVPDGIILHVGETVYANQTVPGRAPSLNASFTIKPPAPTPGSIC